MKPLFLILALVLMINATQRRSATALRSEPIDLQAQELSPGFRGADARSLFASLAKRENSTVKGEFETSAAYAARVASIKNAPLLGRITISSLIGFVPGNGRLGKTETQYDADTGTMTAIVRTIGKGITWSDSSPEHYFYIGQNAFGVKRRVEHYTQEFVNLIVSDSEGYSLIDIPNKDVPSIIDKALLISVEMDVATARRVKSSLRILLVCRLIEPFAQVDTHYVEPTINNPYEEKQINLNLSVHVIEIWLFDQSTGRIFQKRVLSTNRS